MPLWPGPARPRHFRVPAPRNSEDIAASATVHTLLGGGPAGLNREVTRRAGRLPAVPDAAQQDRKGTKPKEWEERSDLRLIPTVNVFLNGYP